MAGKEDQLPFEDGFQRGKHAQAERRQRQAEVTGRRGDGNDMLQRPALNPGLKPVLEATKRRKTGVDSE
jgi:hypothetical protein